MAVTINGTTGIVNPDGSAGTPSLAGSDTNTGVFFPAADTVAIATGGAELARFDGSGISGTAIATQANQEAGSSTSVLVTPGRQQFHPSAAKGWVKAASNGTSAVSFNVSSITDVDVGRVVVNWTVPFSSANYVALGTAQKSTSLSAATTLIVQERTDSTASACHMDIIDSSGTAFQDPNYTNIAAWGDQ